MRRIVLNLMDSIVRTKLVGYSLCIAIHRPLNTNTNFRLVIKALNNNTFLLLLA